MMLVHHFKKPEEISMFRNLPKTAKPITAIAFSAMLLSLGSAQLQAQPAKQAELFYTVKVKLKSTGNGEVFISDVKQGQKEILHAKMSGGDVKPATAKATITR